MPGLQEPEAAQLELILHRRLRKHMGARSLKNRGGDAITIDLVVVLSLDLYIRGAKSAAG